MSKQNKEASRYNFLSKITRSDIVNNILSVRVNLFFERKNKFVSRAFFILLTSFFILTSCNSETKDNSDRFKKGVFEIPAGKGYSKTIITRVDSLQIEEYSKLVSVSNDSTTVEKKIKHIDTLYIKWKNNFFYTLKMKSPKKELDNDPIFVQITKVTDNSYDFTAKIGFSKFKQNGTAYKLK